MVQQLIQATLLLVVSVMVTCSRREKGEFCTLGGQRYRLGQTWHPTLAPFEKKECINCTCYEGGEVKCVKIDCPRPDCEVPKILPGDCCPTCEVGKEGSSEKEAERPGCEFDGKSFKHGDLFPSNTTGIRPTRSDQCVICYCAEGTVLCHLKTCLPTKCKKFKSVSDDCCPQCADKYVYTEDYFDYILSDPKQENRTDADCTSPMGVHKNGSSWKPVIAEYGEMECITCTCLNGNFTCKRLDCPAEESLPCPRPRLMPNSCCKSCPPANRRKGGRLKGRHKGKPSPGQGSDGGPSRGEAAADGGRGAEEGGDNGGGRMKKKKKHNKDSWGGPRRGRGKKRKKNRGRRKNRNKGHSHRKCKASDKEEVHPERKANVTSVSAIFLELCLPRRMDRVVYRVARPDYELLAFDDVTDPLVEVLRWNVENGKSQAVNRTILQAERFRGTVTCDQIAGATNKRGFKKLLKKVDSKTRRCSSKKRRCLTKALDKVLHRDRRLKALPTRRVCGP